MLVEDDMKEMSGLATLQELQKLKDFDIPVIVELNFDAKAAEKFIVSLKLQRYITRLNNDKKAVLQLALSGDAGASTLIKDLDDELKSANEKLEKLMNME